MWDTHTHTPSLFGFSNVRPIAFPNLRRCPSTKSSCWRSRIQCLSFPMNLWEVWKNSRMTGKTAIYLVSMNPRALFCGCSISKFLLGSITWMQKRLEIEFKDLRSFTLTLPGEFFCDGIISPGSIGVLQGPKWFDQVIPISFAKNPSCLALRLTSRSFFISPVQKGRIENVNKIMKVMPPLNAAWFSVGDMFTQTCLFHPPFFGPKICTIWGVPHLDSWNPIQ